MHSGWAYSPLNNWDRLYKSLDLSSKGKHNFSKNIYTADVLMVLVEGFI